MKVLLHCGKEIVEMKITALYNRPPQDIFLSMPVRGYECFILTDTADGMPLYHPKERAA